ncbi:hypothetical protein [Terrabacter sp. C0L_2]|jgi:hypothetical protein|uniref:hypothetical protein n=1 Tax=Terrabacter sp. C0L_2 TaxID=3108389 RepID=UPI002ED52D27|nr:hypothetical protein U5C87_09540 [Terrabacter sp. C0L_2]
MTHRTSLALHRSSAVAVAVAAVCLSGCAAAPDGAPGTTVSGVSCPTAGPFRASELDRLSVCELPPGAEISIDLWPGGAPATGTGTAAPSADEMPAGSVQNVGECAGSAEGVPVTVCTFAAPVGTAGFAGEADARVWFGSPEGVARVRSTMG